MPSLITCPDCENEIYEGENPKEFAKKNDYDDFEMIDEGLYTALCKDCTYLLDK